MFSKACEYGIRAVIHIAVRSNNNIRTSLKDISKEIHSPEAFTAKILQQLAKSDIIDSIKGPNGGFEIEKKKMAKIKLSHIVLAIDGDSIFKGCGLGLKDCSEVQPCPVHYKFKKIRNELKQMLENTSVYELSLGLKDGSTFLKL
ncbi:MAG: Rrf2 family transcriptional regulator [Bacteroidetes bacterium]|nr:Rrf2 family transcriptional regulator [Bacteroidota bacterium]